MIRLFTRHNIKRLVKNKYMKVSIYVKGNILIDKSITIKGGKMAAFVAPGDADLSEAFVTEGDLRISEGVVYGGIVACSGDVILLRRKEAGDAV